MITEDDLMQCLIDEISSVPVLGEKDVTVERLAAKSGRKTQMVLKMLTRKVENGELVIVKKYDPAVSRNRNVYVAAS